MSHVSSEHGPVVQFALHLLDAEDLDAMSTVLVQDMTAIFGARFARVLQGRRCLAQSGELVGHAQVWRFPLTSGQSEFPLILEVSLGPDDDLLLLRQQFMDLAAIARRTAGKLVAFEQERRRAREDGLTGLANRRTFEEALGRHLEHLSARGGVLSVMLVDLDKFKQVNDTYGHAAGDDVLRAVGDACRKYLRTDDIAARLGGDEFVILLAQTAGEHAQVVADRLRRGFREDTRSRGATMSIGIADTLSLPEGERLSAEKLVARADRSLYASKQAGRDCVRVASAA